MGPGQARLDYIRETLRIGSFLVSSNFMIIKTRIQKIELNMSKFREISWKIMILPLKTLVSSWFRVVWESKSPQKYLPNHPKPRFWEAKSWFFKISREILTWETHFFSMSFYDHKVTGNQKWDISERFTDPGAPRAGSACPGPTYSGAALRADRAETKLMPPEWFLGRWHQKKCPTDRKTSM